MISRCNASGHNIIVVAVGDDVVVLLHFRFLCYTHIGLLLFLRALLLGSGFVTFSVFVLHIYRCVVVFARTAAAVPPTAAAAAAAAAEARVLAVSGYIHVCRGHLPAFYSH